MKTLVLLFFLFSPLAFSAITFTVGESPILNLTAANNGTAFDITGSSIVTRFLKTNGVAELEINSGQHTIISGTAGTFTVDLNGSDLSLLETGANKTFVSIVTIGGKDFYFWGRNALTIFPSLIKDQ